MAGRTAGGRPSPSLSLASCGMMVEGHGRARKGQHTTRLTLFGQKLLCHSWVQRGSRPADEQLGFVDILRL